MMVAFPFHIQPFKEGMMWKCILLQQHPKQMDGCLNYDKKTPGTL